MFTDTLLTKVIKYEFDFIRFFFFFLSNYSVSVLDMYTFYVFLCQNQVP